MEEFEDPYARPLDGCFAIVFVMLCIAILVCNLVREQASERIGTSSGSDYQEIRGVS